MSTMCIGSRDTLVIHVFHILSQYTQSFDLDDVAIAFLLEHYCGIEELGSSTAAVVI